MSPGTTPIARAMRRAARAGNGAVRDALTQPHIVGESAARFTGLGSAVRVAVGLAALPALLLLPDLGLEHRSLLVAVIVLVYLPYTVVMDRWSRASARPAVRFAGLFGDVAIVFVITLVAPVTRVAALFVYLLVVAFHTFLGGFVMGASISVAVVAGALAAEAAAGTSMVSEYTFVVFGAALLALAAIVAQASEESRRTARFLVRLQRALGSVPAAPDLDDTLRSVARAAREAVDAKFVSVLVREEGGITQGALEGDHDPDPAERSSEIIARILADPMASPSGIALTTGKEVVVPVIADDLRFAAWIPETERQGFTSTVATPLRTGDSVVGVVAAYFRSPEQVTPETVDLLRAYAEHVTLVILRALAFEHERVAASRLAEADSLKTELVATVSHELRTPLTSVKGFVETVLRHWDRFDEEERKSLLGRALANADQLSSLIDQVLDYSRLEAGAVATRAEAVALEPAVRRSIAALDPVLDGHDLVVVVPHDLGVVADPEGLHRVLGNLLANAGKYSPLGTNITVAARRSDGEVVVLVSDEGPGIPLADQDRIFERFERGEPGHGPRGTGIGLAIVRRYLDMMGGRVWVESEPGQGSTFAFTLPTAAVGVTQPAAR